MGSAAKTKEESIGEWAKMRRFMSVETMKEANLKRVFSSPAEPKTAIPNLQSQLVKGISSKVEE